ncbi:uncharacterized protein BX663DRAFT_507273 [Cokeromyces recurvatus]|uniref:uncharacterized protein n=1 Tax=Cokeromyces recurvatus TaxID=90255 RepID=UPI0022205840|nr:uncharacterized protein BX663DRAFT_507273 [Cokeromyces recurvatus]KAI7903675.1 hypothetical protein BX663DRAFT_507273 [Cokeromyces recurvatus]
MSSSNESSSPTISIEKPITTKDIANLYSHLQTMIEHVPKSPHQLTPTTSSTSLKQFKKEPDCPCHHILVSKDSEHCALCDETIPAIQDIQHDPELIELQKKSNEVNRTLERTKTALSSLEQDMVVLQKKYETEKEEAEKAQKAKRDVENELEELSQRLFEEANGMVADEKRQRHELEVQYEHLKEELRICREQMEAEELQLRELKEKMCAQSTEERVDTGSKLEQRASRDMTRLFQRQPMNTNNNDIDSLIFKEFKEFVKTDVPLRKIHLVSYMKNSFAEDIEPCLRFARLSSKKLCEAILLNTCFIEETPYGFAREQIQSRPADMPLKISAAKTLIWERLSNSVFEGCQACGRISGEDSLPYRFRISVIDDWACIDRYCRDRLVSVCEFYTFVRNVRQGYYNGRTIDDLYSESIRLKLQMFYARMGTLSQTLHQMGVKGDEMGHASQPNMIIPPPIEDNTIMDKNLSEDKKTDEFTNENNALNILEDNNIEANKQDYRNSLQSEKNG